MYEKNKKSFENKYLFGIWSMSFKLEFISYSFNIIFRFNIEW